MEYKVDYPHGLTFIRNRKVIATPLVKKDCVEITVHDGALNVAYVIDDLQKRGIEFKQTGSKIQLEFGEMAWLLNRLRIEKPALFRK